MAAHVQLLGAFIDTFVVRGRRDRVRKLLQTKRGLARFRSDLHHQLDAWLDQRRVVAEIPADGWARPAVRFNAEGEPFESFDTLGEAFAAGPESILCLSTDGLYVAYRPETFHDGERLLWANARQA